MSEDGFSDGFEEPNMEIQIKTLMGTTFDIKVSPTETVEDIKKKIYRVEGIPIYQQNLIFQSKELKDTNRLGDAGIHNGSTLTLVASMRGGPISTRRLSVACEHHLMIKELKELLENTRDEIAPGSKVSVLVFKDGDIINLLRVIENEDGSYSPYSEKPISPPQKPARRECRTGIFERLAEDSEMSTKMANLRQKMEEVSVRKRGKVNNGKTVHGSDSSKDKTPNETTKLTEGKTHPLAFKFLAECGNDFLDNVNLKIYEKNFEEESEEEIALKDKHRSKPHRTAKIKSKSLYNESKGAYSHTKQNYARIHKKARDLYAGEGTSSDRTLEELPPPRKPIKELTSSLAEQFAVLEEEDQDLYGESVSVSARNRLHLTRLVLSETAERPKSSPNSIELEENAQDLWEIHEPASERLKHSATCKVGLLKRRQSLDYGFEGIENTPKSELGNFCKNSEFEVCSGNFYHMPQFVSSPSAIPPQYAPKDQGLCDYYFSKPSRNPLYGRKSKDDALKREQLDNGDLKTENYSFLSECSSIQRLKNDSASERDGLDSSIDELYGYYNLGCSADLLGEKISESTRVELPPVVKKRARCSECNKRLNITNIHNCRCGKIFCSQHRYSEVHRCSYDYKTEGRKILEQQNPLVTAEKIHRI